MNAGSFWTELRRRGVLGAVVAYVVMITGALQLADVVQHALDLPPWTTKALVWLSIVGLPLTAVISWFYDLTLRGLVLTMPPPASPNRSPHASPAASPASPNAAASPQPGSPQTPSLAQPLDAKSLTPESPPLAGRYRIERELGAGGMGRVLAAQDEKLGRRVAIKVLTGAHDAGRLARFSQEARTAGSLEHPNVLAVYDLGDHEGAPFLVTELLDGATLREQIRKGPLDPAAALKLALQLARGLEAAHARGVVHRDLKPENLFLTRDGRLKILDFGLAKLIDPIEPQQAGLTATGAIFGTPGYFAPEQAKGLSADARSDIFAVGAVLYELLSGKRAFPGGSLVEAGHAAIVQEPPPLPLRVPPQLARVVANCLAKDPARRYQSGKELLRALEEQSDAPQLIPPKPVSTANMLRFAVLVLAVTIGLAWVVRRHPSASAREKRDAAAELARDLRETQASAEQAREEQAAAEETARALRTQPHPLPTLPTLPSARAPLPPVPPAAPRGIEAPEVGTEPPDPDEIANFTSRFIPKDAKHFDKEAFKKQLAEVLKSAHGDRIGIMKGARSLEAAGLAPQAESMLRQAIARDPEDIYPRLHLFALERIQGNRETAKLELRKFVSDADDEDWIMPVARFYLGEISEDDLLKTAEESDDDDKKASQLCEANFYAGLFYETAKPPQLDKAKALFAKAATADVNDVEKEFAAEELRTLGKPH